MGSDLENVEQNLLKVQENLTANILGVEKNLQSDLVNVSNGMQLGDTVTVNELNVTKINCYPELKNMLSAASAVNRVLEAYNTLKGDTLNNISKIDSRLTTPYGSEYLYLISAPNPDGTDKLVADMEEGELLQTMKDSIFHIHPAVPTGIPVGKWGENEDGVLNGVNYPEALAYGYALSEQYMPPLNTLGNNVSEFPPGTGAYVKQTLIRYIENGKLFSLVCGVNYNGE